MFCARCGEQIPEASEVCSCCGQEAPVKLQRQAGQPVSAPGGAAASSSTTSQAASPSPIRKDLQGVGGWLLVFCISFTILWPLWMISNSLQHFLVNPIDALRLLSQYSFHHFLSNPVDGLRLLCLILGVVVGVTLWIQSPMAISLLKMYFIFTGILMVLSIYGLGLGILSLHAPFSIWFPILFWVALKWVAPSVVFLVLGITYFSRSERVRATFGRNL